ncbi:MAG: LptF/LptG family permease, partial [Syntrophobacteraceae bacterium]|nr:LptF/LptG family permease [Syntrophobacteraceae bacterium]
TLGVGVFLAYYVLLSAGKGLGENDIIPAWLAMWTPNILTTALALYLWSLMHADTPSRAVMLLGRMASGARNRLRRRTHSKPEQV